MANQSRAILMASLTAVAADVVGAAMPIVSLIGAVNGPVTQQQFITETLYKDDPLSDEVLVKSRLSVPADRFDETVARIQRDLQGSVLRSNRNSRAIILYRTPDGVQQQVLIESIRCPLTEQEMQSSELSASRILGIQDEMGGREVLLVRTAFGHLAVRVGTDGNVAPLEGDTAVLHTHPGAAENNMLMMPSTADTSMVKRQGNRQAILHARGVTFYDAKTVSNDNAEQTTRTVSGAILISTLDVMLGVTEEGDAIVIPRNGSDYPIRRVEDEIFTNQSAEPNRQRTRGSLGYAEFNIPGQEIRVYDFATINAGDVQALRAEFNTVAGEDLMTVDSGDRYHKVAGLLERVATIRPDLMDDVLNVYTDVMVTTFLSQSAYDAVMLALAEIYVSQPEVWQHSYNRDWLMSCLEGNALESKNAVGVLTAMVAKHPALFDRATFENLVTDPEVSAEVHALIRERILPHYPLPKN